MGKSNNQIFADLKGDIDKIIISESDKPIDQIYKIIQQKFNFTFSEDQFIGTGSEDPNDEGKGYIIIERRYDESQLNILEDIHTNDWTASESVLKKAHFIWGRHGKTALDTKLEYSKDSAKRKALNIIYKNKKYTKTKQAIDNINCEDDVDLHTKGIDGTISALVYGRACIQKVYVQQTEEELKDATAVIQESKANAEKTEAKIPTALKLLNSRRLGRVKINPVTNKIIAVEYLDVKKKSGDEEIEVDDDEKFLPIEDLIYIVNSDGGVSTNSQFTGVSRYESIINISMVKRIIMNQNIKEAAKTHYAGLLIATFPEDTDDNVILGWIANAAKAAGRWFAHKLQVKIDHWKADTDLDKYGPLVELLDDAIMKAIGVPSALLGKETVKYSNMEELLIAWREGELQFWRTWVKGWLQRYYLNPLFTAMLPTMTDAVIQTEGIEPPSVDDSPPEPYEKEEQEEPPKENPEVEEESLETEQEPELPEDEEIIITDADVKISYEFHDISFLPKSEIIAGLKMLKDMGVPLTVEMLLRAAGYDEWVEEIMQEDEKVKAEKKEEHKKQLEIMKENMQNGNNQNDPNNPNPNQPPNNNNPFAKPPAVPNPNIAVAEDLLFLTKDPVYKKLLEKKMIALDALIKKINEG